ncbi:MAG: DnaJ domain-containing protein [Flavobacteriales bacterium]|nr:DnaJ domain-containing protein [Flavobacteriales bacterium]
MINCYKILEIPDFSDENTIQKSFRMLAKKYHPDVSGLPNAEEKFKLIAKAYQTLSHPNSKKMHDDRLRRPYESFAEIQQKREAARQKDLEARQRRRAELLKIRDLKFYEAEEAYLPYQSRIAGYVLVMIVGGIIAFKYWYVNLLDENIYMPIAFGLCISGVGVAGCINVWYKKLRFDFLKHQTSQNFERKSMQFGLYVALVFALIFGVSNKFRKEFQLKYNGVYDYAHFREDTFNKSDAKVLYKTDEGYEVKKERTLTSEHIVDYKNGRVLIKYSRSYPEIMELVVRKK